MTLTWAKALMAALTAFLGFAAAKGIALPWYLEGLALALIAGVSVYWVPNRIPPNEP